MNRLRKLLVQEAPDLPPMAIHGERDGNYYLDLHYIASDLHEFLACLDLAQKATGDEAKAALQRAVDLYQGDLLIGPTERNYRWLDERRWGGLTLRETYRNEWKRHAGRLAHMYMTEDQPDLAIPLFRKLLALEPTLEDVVRDLYRCFEQTGNRGALLAADKELRAALAEAYERKDVEPEPETIARFQEIMSRLETKRAA